MKFTRSVACQNAFYHKDRAIRIIVHGDGFLMAGPEKELVMLRKQMDEKYEAKHQVIGPRADHAKSMKVLNREIKWEDKGITIEADKKHVRAIIQELGLEGAKAVSTLGVKDRHEKMDQELAKHKELEQGEEEPYARYSSKVDERRADLRTRIRDSGKEKGEPKEMTELEVDGRPREALSHKVKGSASRECTLKSTNGTDPSS